MNKKYSIIATVIILAVAGGVYAWQKNTDPYKGWKTYRNEEVGYSVRYPGEYVAEKRMSESGNSSGVTLDHIVFQAEKEETPAIVISLKVYQDPLFSFLDFENETFIENKESRVKYTLIDVQEGIPEKINNENFEGTWLEVTGDDGSTSIEVILLQEPKQKFLRITALMNSQTISQGKEILERLIASIQVDGLSKEEQNQQESKKNLDVSEKMKQFNEILLKELVSQMDKESLKGVMENLKKEILETHREALEESD